MSDTPTATEEVKAPAPKFTFKKGDETKEIIMSFALVDVICRAVADPERMFLIGLDFELNKVVLSHLLTLDDKGRPHPEKYDEFEDTAGISSDDIKDLLTWAAEHATHFFTGVASQAVSRLSQQREKLAPVHKQIKQIETEMTNSLPGLGG